MSVITLIRGGGDLGSGVALRLYRAGLRVVIAELAEPLAVRRKVSFAEAVYNDAVSIEGITGKRVDDPADTLRVLQILARGEIPVLVDPEGASISALHPGVVVDARMIKTPAGLLQQRVGLLIGLGPGFVAGENCHVVVETNRGHYLGRVIWEGAPEADTGIPDPVLGLGGERVIRAPASGTLTAHVEIGDVVKEGDLLAEIGGQPVAAPFGGVLRGLIRPGLAVRENMKIGDLDPRGDPRMCMLVSDKSLAVAGGVLEAILSRRELRTRLWA